jgi:hypothetical protein
MENIAEIYSDNELFGNRSKQILFIVIYSICIFIKKYFKYNCFPFSRMSEEDDRQSEIRSFRFHFPVFLFQRFPTNV